MNEAEITDTLGTDDEMPRISVAICDVNRVVFYDLSIAKHRMTRRIFIDNSQGMKYICCWRMDNKYEYDFSDEISRKH